jgi:hypothetical protein
VAARLSSFVGGAAIEIVSAEAPQSTLRTRAQLLC